MTLFLMLVTVYNMVPRFSSLMIKLKATFYLVFVNKNCINYNVYAIVGLGTEIDNERALNMYSIAARKFGHFDAVSRLGVMHHEGVGIKRSATEALKFLEPASSMGSWSGWLRRGLDQYIAA